MSFIEGVSTRRREKVKMKGKKWARPRQRRGPVHIERCYRCGEKVFRIRYHCELKGGSLKWYCKNGCLTSWIIDAMFLPRERAQGVKTRRKGE